MKVNSAYSNINASFTRRMSSKQSGLNLMQSMSSNVSNADMFSLANDYAQMKTSGYKQLVRANYTQQTSTQSSTKNETNQDMSSEFSAVKEEATELATNASSLYTTGSSSLFKSDKDGQVNMDKLLEATKSFVSSYNEATTSANATGNNALKGVVSTMRNMTKLNENNLKEIGITITDKQTMSLDEEKFKNADVSKIKSLFNGSKSYAYNIGSNALTLGSTSAIEGIYQKTGVNQYSSSLSQYI